MLRPICLSLLFCGSFLASVDSADAAFFDFSYTFSTGDSLTGVLEGTLQADLNTVLVSSLISASFSGDAGLMFNTDVLLNTATLDGMGTLFVTGAPDNATLGGFQIDEPFDTVLISDPFFNFDPIEGFNPANWSLTQQAAVPEPSTFLLLGIGIAGLGLCFRRRPEV